MRNAAKDEVCAQGPEGRASLRSDGGFDTCIALWMEALIEMIEISSRR